MPSGGYPAQNGYPHQSQSQANPSMAPNAVPGQQASGAQPTMRGVSGSGPYNRMQPQNSGGHSPPTGGNTPYDRGDPPGQDPRYDSRTGQNPGYGGGPPVNPTSGASTGTETNLRGATVTQNGTRPATGPHPTPHVQHGPYTDPTPQVRNATSGPQGSQAVSEAVRAAYKEGGDFGESIARDAPALWVEAVLAGQPRMPADLEARLLQGSALPVDYLLRDDVRGSLRSGFWAALERCRA